MQFVSKYNLRNSKPSKKRLQNPFEMCSSCRNESRLIKSLSLFLQHELKPETRVPKSDLSLETGASLAIYLCGHEKKHKVALSLGSVWYAAAGPLSSQTRRGLKAETSKVASVYLHLLLKPQKRQMMHCSARGAIWTFPWCPANHSLTLSIYSHKCFILKVYFLCNDWPESTLWKLFICLSNMLQELESGDFRGSFSFLQLWV